MDDKLVKEDAVIGDVGDYRLLSKIGSGSFGDVYVAENRRTLQRVAIKIESSESPYPQLHFEYKLYRCLSTGKGIPRVYRYFSTSGYNLMAMDLLGPSLEELFNLCSRRFSLKTVLLLVNQMIERVEFVHNNGFVHRDIKPDNFLMGADAQNNLVYIIDFGLAKKYFDAKKNLHISYKRGGRLTGTARYASANALLGREISRRDDMEALGYVFMYFLRGSLPWQGLPCTSKKQRHELIAEMKYSIKFEDLCKGYPKEFVIYFRHCRSLSFEEKPQYQQMRNSFTYLYSSLKYANDGIYDWISKKQLYIDLAAAREKRKRKNTETAPYEDVYKQPIYCKQILEL